MLRVLTAGQTRMGVPWAFTSPGDMTDLILGYHINVTPAGLVQSCRLS